MALGTGPQSVEVLDLETVERELPSLSREVDFLARVRLDPTPRGQGRRAARAASDDPGRQDADASDGTRRPAGEPGGAEEADRAVNGGHTCLVLIEFQTRWRTNMPHRAASYAMRGYDQHGLPVWPVVVVLQPGGRIADRWQMDGAGRTVLQCQFQVVRLWELPREHVIAQQWVGLYPLLPLMEEPVDDLEVLLPETEALIVGALPPPVKPGSGRTLLWSLSPASSR